MAERIEDELFEQIDARADRVVVEGERTLTFHQLGRWAAGIAAALEEAGVEPGDRVAVWTGKSSAEVASLYGAWMAGAIAVPIHDVLKRAQVAHVLDHCAARAVLTTGRVAHQLDDALREGRAVLDPSALPERAPRRRELPGGDEPAALLYTSGSTGRPKGILVSHGNLRAGARIVTGYLGLREDDRILSVLPFSFDYGLNQLLGAVHLGATLVLARSSLPARICRHLEEDEITVLAGVPPLWARLMGRGSPLAERPPKTLRLMTNSGGAFPVALLERYQALLPDTDICLMYGLTEAFRSTYLPPHELRFRPTSMGRAIPETQLMVLGPDGAEVGPDEEGELVHAGPTVSLGYWNDIEATRARYRPHPTEPGKNAVFSGDRVRRDADGYFYFVGRADQQMKCSGVRVSPDEVEELVFASNLVEEVAVTGEPDDVVGTRPVAHVVLAGDPEKALAELDSWCRREMPSYMQPRLVIRDALPRTASGKLDKKGLAA